MQGPAAPKDPEQKRPFFYIMKDKEVFGSIQEDGRGIQYLYQSDGRLANSAQIVGNIEDETIVKLLETVDGFKKLVHSIGVSAETQDPNERIKFVFQMYGKKDIYGGGTNLSTTLQGNGAEKRIYLSEIEWKEDDHVPGQIKILFDTPEKISTISVRLYLNDGYEAPEYVDEQEVDVESFAYQKMIQKSLIQYGSACRLKGAIERAKKGEDVTIAYIGGSITQGAGATPIHTECYAYKSFCHFQKITGAKENVHFVKAGVGGTPSELGMIRFDRDVRENHRDPDVVIVEFAVNDEGDETKGDCYESLVRKILKLESQPAVILLFSVFADDYNLQERLLPVGNMYDLAMVSIKDAVTPQFYDRSNRIVTKNQYFYDRYHPSNLGHTIMADCLGNLFKVVADLDVSKASDETEKLLLKGPAIGNTFDKVKLLDKKDTFEKAKISCGGFTETDDILQSVEMNCDLELTPEFPFNWMYDGTKCEKAPFEMTIICKALVLVFKDSGETDAAKAEIYVDGTWVRTADPYVNGWLHCNPVIIYKGAESKEHQVRIQISNGDEGKKFTILGFGYVE